MLNVLIGHSLSGSSHLFNLFSEVEMIHFHPDFWYAAFSEEQATWLVLGRIFSMTSKEAAADEELKLLQSTRALGGAKWWRSNFWKSPWGCLVLRGVER